MPTQCFPRLRRLALVIGLAGVFAASEAHAARLIAVLPLDVRFAKGKIDEAAQTALEEMLRDVASETLGPQGWTVLTGENQLQILSDNGLDPTKCGEQSCHLAAARELKAELFISGTVQWTEGELTASIRLLDSNSGRIVASERLSGASAKVVRKAFEAKAPAFFAKVSAVPSTEPVPGRGTLPVAEVTRPQVKKGAVTVAVGKLTVTAKPRENVRLELVDPSGIGIVSAAPYENPTATPGRWKVTARATGFEDASQAFDVPADDVTLIRVELKALGGLLVKGEPAGSAVTVTGPGGFKDEGGLPWEASGLSSGSYQVVVARGGYIDDARTVEVTSGKTAEVSVALEKVGSRRSVAGTGLDVTVAVWRDDRRIRSVPRARALLVTEIQGLERLFENTSRNAADRPALARRLAESYVELENAASRDQAQAEITRDELKTSDAEAAGKKQADATQAAKVAQAGRKMAQQYYNLLLKDYPNDPRRDETLYFLAFEYEGAGDLANARKLYFQLIQERPQSKYIPEAYLAFGELFYSEAESDSSKWSLAAQAYTEVTKYPAPENKAYGYAWYKLALVHSRQGELAKALNDFKKTIDYGVQFAQLPNAAKLAVAARHGIIPAYAMAGDPKAAFTFFGTVSGDEGNDHANTFKMMDELGQSYLASSHYAEALTIYRELATRDRSAEHATIYESGLTRAKSGLKTAQPK